MRSTQSAILLKVLVTGALAISGGGPGAVASSGAGSDISSVANAANRSGVAQTINVSDGAVVDPGNPFFQVLGTNGRSCATPYFHNGSAATLMDVVRFYDARFGIGFTAEERGDLAAFLGAL